MTQCDKCRSDSSCERPWKSMVGTMNCVGIDPIMTNGDRIREMTDEELAYFLERYCFQYGWLEWLRQEAKEGE